MQIKKHQISSTKFTITGTDTPDLLEFCASTPYSLADKEKAKEFVRKNLGNNAKIPIGDAIFELINNGEKIFSIFVLSDLMIMCYQNNSQRSINIVKVINGIICDVNKAQTQDTSEIDVRFHEKSNA